MPKPREATPPVQLAGWLKSLPEGEDLPPCSIVRGDEAYLRRRAVLGYIERAKELDAEITTYDGNDPDKDLPRLLGDLSTPSMFAARQALYVRSFDKELRKVGKDHSPLSRALLAFIERAEPGRSVLIEAPGLRADHAVAKAIKTRGGAVLSMRRLYDSPPPWKPDPLATELVQWVIARARELEQPLPPREAARLAAFVGNNLDAIDDQLAKLKSLGPNAGVDALDFQKTVAPWELADLLLSGETARALATAETLFQNGFAGKDGRIERDPKALFPILFGSLRNGLRQGLAATAELERGADPRAAAERAGVNGRGLDAFVERLRRWPRQADWLRRLEDVADLERRSRSSAEPGPEDLALIALRWRPPAPAAGRR
ncbi:MAG: DNA polymerase III subunit delta [Planctomycetota bacterium]|jgi:DNA polymerase III delta subunit